MSDRDFVGRPESWDVVGQSLGRDMSAVVCKRCNVRGHLGFECPAGYFARLGDPCPGFDASGVTVAAGWVGGELTAASRAAWRGYILRHSLEPSRSARHTVAF